MGTMEPWTGPLLTYSQVDPSKSIDFVCRWDIFLCFLSSSSGGSIVARMQGWTERYLLPTRRTLLLHQDPSTVRKAGPSLFRSQDPRICTRSIGIRRPWKDHYYIPTRRSLLLTKCCHGESTFANIATTLWVSLDTSIDPRWEERMSRMIVLMSEEMRLKLQPVFYIRSEACVLKRLTTDKCVLLGLWDSITDR